MLTVSLEWLGIVLRKFVHASWLNHENFVLLAPGSIDAYAYRVTPTEAAAGSDPAAANGKQVCRTITCCTAVHMTVLAPCDSGGIR